MRTDLQLVRKGADVFVYTQHPDHVRPRDITKFLLNTFGGGNFSVYLLSNLYIIYIQQQAMRGEGFAAAAGPHIAQREMEQTCCDRDPAPACQAPDDEQLLKDIEDAEEVLVRWHGKLDRACATTRLRM